MVTELKNRNREIKEKRRLLKQDEVYHGALEDILLGKYYIFCLILFMFLVLNMCVCYLHL